MKINVADLNSDNARIWRQFVSSHESYLRKFVFTCVLDSAVTEEIVQDVFLVVWKQRHTLPEDSDLKKYMFRCARNLCWDHLEKLRIKTIPIDELDLDNIYRRSNSYLLDSEALDKLYEDDLRKMIRETLGKMSSQTREIFWMSREQNLSNKEIAERMNLSEKAIEYHISKAIKLIRKDLPVDYWLLSGPVYLVFCVFLVLC